MAGIWNSTKVSSCPMYSLIDKLKVLKRHIKDWNHNVFGDVNKKVFEAKESLSKIQDEISQLGLTHERFNQEVEAKLKVLDCLKIQHQFWQSKVRLSWLKDGDRCTRFFHTYAKVRAAKSSISCLKIGNSLTSDSSLIADHIVHYYKNLYSSPGTASPLAHLEEIIPTLVTEADNSFLTSIPTEEEIHKTIFSMDPHSAPGPDEFSGAFFQGCWDIIKAEVIQFVQYFFQHSWLPPNLNSNLITLILKVAEADSVNQFRPIALANFLFNP